MEIAMQPVTSSQIDQVGYDEPTRTLAIQFKGAGGRPGSVYHYSNVEPETFAAFQKTDSVGRFFGTTIKPFTNRYPFKKVDQTPQPVA